MDERDFKRRLSGLRDCPGHGTADLRVGRWVVRFEGLDDTIRTELVARWGVFLHPVSTTAASVTVRIVRAGSEPWLGPPRFRGERYRIEPFGSSADRIVVSHNFAVEPRAGCFRLAITEGTQEPVGRIVENAARLALAQLAMREDGFALHAGGVLDRGRAWIYCGPSRSGKSTAVAASSPAGRLGDDFAVVVRRESGWFAPSVPFDSAERVESTQPQGEFAVAGMVRLYHGPAFRVERPAPTLASVSLLGCAAFPWLFPERADELLGRVQRVISEVGYTHVYFTLDTDLHRELLSSPPSLLDSPERAP